MKSILLVALLFASSANACVNTYSARLQGQLASAKGQRAQAGPLLRQLEQANASKPTPTTTNDLAVAYIFAGEYRKAIALLRGLEEQHPGLAKTAANLGTALELSGDNVEALHWIKQGVLRDSNEHQGTEWLHVKILEAKLQVAKNPQWLTNHTILGIDFGTKDVARLQMPRSLPTDFRGRPLTLADIETALRYQLQERVSFVTPPDPYMADLFTDWGNIVTVLKSQSASQFPASGYYEAAAIYGRR